MIKKLKKKICFITSSRAEYGIISNLLTKIERHKDFDLYFIITGSHLSYKHGYTFKEILKDGFNLSKIFKVNTYTSDDTKKIVSTISKNFNAYYKILIKINPDLVFVLGDRYELIPAGYVSLFVNKPLVHFHGGELTIGAYDDYIRNTITKLSSIHFVVHNVYKNRVIQMGENKKNVYNFGGLGAENIELLRKKFLSKQQVEKLLDFKFRKKNILITYHPVTLEFDKKNLEFKILLDALCEFPKIGIIFTSPNSDTHNAKIIKMINKFIKKNKNSIFVTSLGKLNYFSTINICDCVIGNSSSGILEVPSLNKYTINIGDRQKGRIMSKTVINIKPIKKIIIKSISYVLNNSAKIKNKKNYNVYYKSRTSDNIIKVLQKIKLPINLKKGFYDL